MNDSELQKTIEDLDTAVPKDDARLVIYYEDPDDQFCEFIGNSRGYLRFGIEMLKAAVAPLAEGDSITEIDPGYLLHQRSLLVRRVVRQEKVDAALPPIRETTFWNKLAGVGCLIVVLFLLVCMLVGFFTVLSAIFR